MLLSLDAGLRCCGVGLFRGPTLVRGALIRNPEKRARGMQAWHAMAVELRRWLGPVNVTTFAGECMQIDARTVNPRDLLELNGVLGVIGGSLLPERALTYAPSTWKGSVPGDIWCRRIEKRLSPTELAALEPCPASLRHNMLDGVGLGLFVLGRLTPQRAP
jgi:hypothetical protein